MSFFPHGFCNFHCWDSIHRSVQMKLYTMHKREFVVIFMGFFVALGLVVFIGLVGKSCRMKFSRGFE